MSQDRYESPLSTRYASPYLLTLFSQRTRAVTWRRLWVALARAQHTLGLPVTEAQVRELEAHTEDVDLDVIAARERITRHDVMAHIYAYGLDAPQAAGIIHLGATSCFVTDNADLMLYRDALDYLERELAGVIGLLAAFAERYKATPTLGFTHLQPAQPVTVGKRACLYAQDLVSDLEELRFVRDGLRFLGCRGTTGTEASFLQLFDGDGGKVDRMNALIAEECGFSRLYSVCGQTYPRKVDARIQNALSAVAQSCYRFANDVRLLQHDGVLEEPFDQTQVGSSAMPYKRNPMRCERICSLARYVMTNAQNAPLTASAQWMERTLDDSANRRISMPEAFLATDAVLRLMQNVCAGLVVNEHRNLAALDAYLPFLATETLLMAAVQQGGDRQTLHECIRTHSMRATASMNAGGACTLLADLAADPAFPLDADEIAALMRPERFTGRCPEQVDAFLQTLPDLSAAVRAEEITL